MASHNLGRSCISDAIDEDDEASFNFLLAKTLVEESTNVGAESTADVAAPDLNTHSTPSHSSSFDALVNSSTAGRRRQCSFLA